MRKIFMRVFFSWLVLSAIMGCASTESVQRIPAGQEEIISAGDIMVNVPYRIDSRGATWNWQIFRPAVPADVPGDIYAKLWDINLKTIRAGKYDFNVPNFNTSQTIKYNEPDLSDDFTFEGVCINYADYFIFVLKHDESLLELYNKGVITENISASHKWIEYHTERNRYIIDPTWCDWDYVGEPAGIYAGNAEFAEACITSYNKDRLIEAKSKEWFFRNVRTITRDEDKRVHNS